MSSRDARPLVLLDVDGVLHDRRARDLIRMSDHPDDLARDLGVEMITSHGRRMAIPEYMPGLMQDLVARADVWWCTTWMHRANDELATHLGIGPLPVVGDGERGIGHEWKAATARPLVDAARAEGRGIYWIEDFGGTLPEVPGVIWVDTAEEGILRPDDLSHLFT